MSLFDYSSWTFLPIPLLKYKMGCPATSQCPPFYNKHKIKIFMPVTQEFFYCYYSFIILIINTTIIKDRYLSDISNYTIIFRS